MNRRDSGGKEKSRRKRVNGGSERDQLFVGQVTGGYKGLSARCRLVLKRHRDANFLSRRRKGVREGWTRVTLRRERSGQRKNLKSLN